MTRGNQRDIDRQRALNRAAAHAGGNSTLKNKEVHADALRAKQAAAEERRRQEAAAANQDGSTTHASKPQRAVDEEKRQQDAERMERIRLAREEAEARMIAEQEEEFRLRREARKRAEAEEARAGNVWAAQGRESRRTTDERERPVWKTHRSQGQQQPRAARLMRHLTETWDTGPRTSIAHEHTSQILPA